MPSLAYLRSTREQAGRLVQAPTLPRSSHQSQGGALHACGAGVSGTIQHSRLTVVLAPPQCSLAGLVSVLSARAPRGSILSGCVAVTVGGSDAALRRCRNLIGLASKVRVTRSSAARNSSINCNPGSTRS